MIEYRFFIPSGFLPEGFTYPLAYQVYAASKEHENLLPWRFLYGDEPEFMAGGLQSRYQRSLVPFARRVDSDDIACFENAGAGGTPIVQVIHDFASPGWEQRASFTDFPSWLEWAKSDE